MSKELMMLKRDIVDNVSDKIASLEQEGSLHFPANYSPQNALKSAWLKLQSIKDKNKQPVLQVCTKDSIANSLLDMVIQGLSPAKNQCYFIAWGNNLTLMRSYHGARAVTKRLLGVEDINAQVIYQDDEFEYELVSGTKRVTKHVQSFKNIDNNKIAGAYCTIVTENGEYTEIMTIEQIKTSWKKSKNNPILQNGDIKAGSVHSDFTEEMAKKTVTNRACKYFINESDDSDVLAESINRTNENEYDNSRNVQAQVESEVEENAASEDLDIPEEPAQIEEDKTIKETIEPAKTPNYEELKMNQNTTDEEIPY